jgi:hypothetical protein
VREGFNATLKILDVVLSANTWVKLVDDNVNRTYLSVINNTNSDSIEIGLGSNTDEPTTSFKVIGAASGSIVGDASVYKFGFNQVIQDVEETVWEGGGLYTYPTSALPMTVISSAGATDNGVEITVQGLDANYNEQSVTVTLAGAGTFTTTETFIRVFRAYVSGSQEPTGNISITNGGTTYAFVNGDYQTQMCLWTVPAGYTAYLKQTDVAVHTEQNNKFGTVRLVAREPNGVFRTQDAFTAANDVVTRNYSTVLTFPEKTDLEFRAKASSANANLQVSAIMELTYAKDGAVGIDNTSGYSFPVAPINAVWARSKKSGHAMQVVYDD